MDDAENALTHDRRPSQSPSLVGPSRAVRNFWIKAFVYSGRATRAEYNWALVMTVLLWISVGSLIVFLLPDGLLRKSIEIFLLLVFLVPWSALVVRRCHDMNRRGAFGLLLLATGIGFVVTECFLMFAGSNPLGARFERDLAHASRPA